jgi:hypothetical protein
MGGSAAVAKTARNKANTTQRPIAVFPWTRNDMRRNRIDLSNSLFGYIYYYNGSGQLHPVLG